MLAKRAVCGRIKIIVSDCIEVSLAKNLQARAIGLGLLVVKQMQCKNSSSCRKVVHEYCLTDFEFRSCTNHSRKIVFKSFIKT